MLVTAMTPNIDSHLYVETEDEHRTKTKHLVILFAAMTDAHGNSAIVPVALVDGKLVPGGKRLVRDE